MRSVIQHLSSLSSVRAGWSGRRECEYIFVLSLFFIKYPREDPGIKSRMCSPYPQRRKRRLNWAVSRINRIKRLDPCWCLDRHVKEPYEMSMALGARL